MSCGFLSRRLMLILSSATSSASTKLCENEPPHSTITRCFFLDFAVCWQLSDSPSVREEIKQQGFSLVNAILQCISGCQIPHILRTLIPWYPRSDPRKHLCGSVSLRPNRSSQKPLKLRPTAEMKKRGPNFVIPTMAPFAQ